MDVLKTSVALLYRNGDYIVVPIDIPKGDWPEYISYLGIKFALFNIAANGKRLYKEVNEPMRREEEEFIDPLQAQIGELETQVENLMGLVEEQQSLIAVLETEVEERAKTIDALRKYLHNKDSK